MQERAIIEEVRQKTDIVALVGTYVALQRRGSKYVGLCPFHHEKTPSFQVSPDQGLFYCFGCQTGGDAFGFLQHIENLTFGEALQTLAERAGVSLKAERDPAEVRKRREREELYRALELAARFFRARLGEPVGTVAREYLAGRRLEPATIEQFGLGYAPDGWDHLLSAMRRHGIPESALLRTGLLSRSEQGKVFDRFRNRVMFPIWDRQGRVIGFGGRVLGEGQPKYLNSPEGELFRKGQILYGAHLARRSIREAGYTIVVEGYMDAIACHAAGLGQTVAAMGTALTADQGRWLRQQAEQVVIAFDADAAGAAATLRGLDLLASLGCRVRVVSLPPGADPDDLLKAEGRDGFLKRVEEAESLIQYKIRQAHEAALGGKMPTTADEKTRLAHQLLPVLAAIADPVEFELYVRQVAGSFGFREELLIQQVQRLRREQRTQQRGQQGPEPRSQRRSGQGGHDRPARDSASRAARNDSGNFGKTRQTALPDLPEAKLSRVQTTEIELVRVMLRRPDWVADVRAQVPLERYSHPALRALASSLYADATVQTGWPDEHKQLAARLLLRDHGGSEPDEEAALAADRKLLQDCLANMKVHTNVEREAEIRRLLLEDEHRPDRAELMKELIDLVKERQALPS